MIRDWEPPVDDVEAEVYRITRSLKSHGADVPDDLIERTVRDCFAERDDARIRDFVGLLAERAARERLRRLGAERASGATFSVGT